MTYIMQHSEALKPDWTVSGIVEAPVEQVWPLVLDGFRSTGIDMDAVENYRGSQPYVTHIGKPGNGKITVEVDKAQHSIATQGEWWYRGVYSVTPHPRGSLVTYNVYNIAPGIGHLAAQWFQGRENAGKMKGQLQSSLDAIGRQLGCAVSKVT
jgi:hypothetical protein